MIQIFYKLKNNSKSEGMYLLNGEYVTLKGNGEIILSKKPINMTANISVVTFKKKISEKKVKETVSEVKADDVKTVE